MSYLTMAEVGTNLARVGNGVSRTLPEFEPGTKVVCNDGVYQYVKFLATIAAYELVKISNTFTAGAATTTTLPSTEPAKVGVNNVAGAVVSGEYGWVFVGPGLVTVLVAASCVQDVKLYTTGTQGVVDDSATTLVNGLKLITTITSAAASPCVAECELATVIA